MGRLVARADRSARNFVKDKIGERPLSASDFCMLPITNAKGVQALPGQSCIKLAVTFYIGAYESCNIWLLQTFHKLKPENYIVNMTPY